MFMSGPANFHSLWQTLVFFWLYESGKKDDGLLIISQGAKFPHLFLLASWQLNIPEYILYNIMTCQRVDVQHPLQIRPSWNKDKQNKRYSFFYLNILFFTVE